MTKKEIKGRKRGDTSYYKNGETPARYGLANRDSNGNLIFLQEHSFSMDWSSEQACIWHVPPTHYYNPKRGDFIINFNKKSAPAKLGERTNKGNYRIISSQT